MESQLKLQREREEDAVSDLVSNKKLKTGEAGASSSSPPLTTSSTSKAAGGPSREEVLEGQEEDTLWEAFEKEWFCVPSTDGIGPSREEVLEEQEATLREEFEREHAARLENARRGENLRRSYKYSKDDEMEFPGDGISYSLVDEDLSNWVVVFPGPTGTPYDGGRFQCRLEFPTSFPFDPPKVSMLTKVWHHFFDSETGAVCADILQDGWHPAISRGPQIIRTIQSLLSEPLSEDSKPLNLRAATLWRDDRDRSDLVARHYSSLFAVLDCQDQPSGIVSLKKKDLNAMVTRLTSRMSGDQMHTMLRCIERASNDFEFTMVADSLSACLANPQQISYVVQALERRIDGAGAVTPLLLQSLAKLKNLIPDEIHGEFTAIVNQLKTDEESRAVERCFAECLIWPSNAARELAMLVDRPRDTAVIDGTSVIERYWWNDVPFEDPGRAQIDEPVTFFLSHRGCDSKDNLVQPLHSILGELGIQSFYDKRSIRVGEYNDVEMARGLYSCRFGVVLITENFLNSKWCRKELKTLYHRHTTAKESGSQYKLLLFFASQKIISDPAFKLLKRIGAVVRSAGISDRQFLTSELIPKLMEVLGKKHDDVDIYLRLLDQYLTDSTITAHSSLRSEQRETTRVMSGI